MRRVSNFCSKRKIEYFLIILVLCLTNPAYGLDVALRWDANTETDLAGYRVFYREDGQSYNYNNPAWEGTQTTCTIYSLDDSTGYYFVARAFDTSGNESGDSDEVTYEPSKNTPPTADAGLDQTVNEGSTVTLNGSNSSDSDGSISFSWAQLGGPAVALLNPSAGQATFTAPDVDSDGATLTFLLTVTDDGGLDSKDTCAVHVLWVDDTPFLEDLLISGPSSINENSMSEYIAAATFSDGSTQAVTDDVNWSEDSPYADIDANGVLSTLEVTGDETLTITASYTLSDVDFRTATMDVTIFDRGEGSDSDGDGMPDWWESKYGLNPSADDSGDDLDEDWLSNLAEYENATNPNTGDTDGDGLLDGLEVHYGFDPIDADSKPQLPLLEISEVSVDHNWKRVEFCEPFLDPVVVSKSLSHNGGAPAVIRIRNVDTSGFEIRVQEWEYLNGVHKIESVGYLAMERGSYTLPDEARVEASWFETDKASSFGAVSFNRLFQVDPVVVTAVCSFNGEDTVTGRVRNVSTQGFEFTMQEQEVSDKNHAKEMVAYVAWEPSQGTIAGLSFEVDVTEDVVRHEPHTILFDHVFTDIPVFIAAMQTADGRNTANLRWQNKSRFGIDIWIDEEKSSDMETRHTTEALGYMVFYVPP
jgi:hypothetical protein